VCGVRQQQLRRCSQEVLAVPERQAVLQHALSAYALGGPHGELRCGGGGGKRRREQRREYGANERPSGHASVSGVSRCCVTEVRRLAAANLEERDAGRMRMNGAGWQRICHTRQTTCAPASRCVGALTAPHALLAASR
jgi:hypothetical protein